MKIIPIQPLPRPHAPRFGMLYKVDFIDLPQDAGPEVRTQLLYEVLSGLFSQLPRPQQWIAKWQARHTRYPLPGLCMLSEGPKGFEQWILMGKDFLDLHEFAQERSHLMKNTLEGDYTTPLFAQWLMGKQDTSQPLQIETQYKTFTDNDQPMFQYCLALHTRPRLPRSVQDILQNRW